MSFTTEIFSTDDGYNGYCGMVYHSGTVWSTVRGATTGTVATNSWNGSAGDHLDGAFGANLNGSIYALSRYFLGFGLLGMISPSASISAAYIKVYGYPYYGYSYPTVYQGSQAFTLTTADYANFYAGSFGNLGSWFSSNWNTIPFNSTGIAYLQTLVGTTTRPLFCIRDTSHDVGGITPTLFSTISSVVCFPGIHRALLGVTYDLPPLTQQVIFI